MTVIAKIIAGIVLIIVILMLNLTVSAGTLNGLIFYANVLAAVSSLFLITSIEQKLNLRKLKIRLIDDPRFKNIHESEMQEAGVIVPTSTEVTLSPSKDSSDERSSDKISTDGEHCRVESEETVMNDSFENVCKQKIHKKGKRWTNSNTLREPLLQD